MHQTQYPAVQGPVSLVVTVAVPTWFQNDTQQKRPRRWAQQPASYSFPTEDPSLFTVPAAFTDAQQAQRRPRRWAQQPNAYTAPVKVITASSRRKFGQII